MNEIFSTNKECIRKLDLIFIDRIYKSTKNSLVYFGLPSQEMGDVLLWKDYLKTILAVEYGDFREDNTYIRQHNLMLTAFKNGIVNKLVLYRGDIDDIILQENDTQGVRLNLPLDLINLDYSSGFIRNDIKRLEAIKKIFRYQKTRSKSEFIMFISVNLKHDPAILRQYFSKAREQAETADQDLCSRIDSLLDDSISSEITRLKVFVLSIIKSYSALENYLCAMNKPIFYLGNRDTPMLHFSFHFRLSSVPISPPVNKDILKVCIDKAILVIENGELNETPYCD